MHFEIFIQKLKWKFRREGKESPGKKERLIKVSQTQHKPK
jgi:hypothetical protein